MTRVAALPYLTALSCQAGGQFSRRRIARFAVYPPLESPSQSLTKGKADGSSFLALASLLAESQRLIETLRQGLGLVPDSLPDVL